MRTLIIIAAALAPLALAIPASAAEVSTVKVRYADLDLATESGRHTLDSRIAGAVRTVCGTGASLAEQRDAAKCRETAKAEAWSQANAATRTVVASR